MPRFLLLAALLPLALAAAENQPLTTERLRDQLGRQVWPAHRLDKGTSGLLLFALSAEIASLLGQAFEQGLAAQLVEIGIVGLDLDQPIDLRDRRTQIAVQIGGDRA